MKLHWPQIVVLILSLLGVIHFSVKWIKSSLSSTHVTAAILALLLYYGLYFMVLHEGGFW